MKMPRKTLLTIALTGLLGFSASAQLNLSSANPAINENFDSMWSSSLTEQSAVEQNISLPEGWRVEKNLLGPRQVGNWEDFPKTVTYAFSIDLASNEKNGTYTFGNSENINDRAVGGLTTSVDGGARGINVATLLKNSDDSKIITNLDLVYNIEKYRYGNNEAGFSVRIFTSKDGLRWTEAEELVTGFTPDATTKGALVVPISTTQKNDNLRVHLEPGDELYLAWNISVSSGTACASAPGLAIDDVSITATFSDTDDDWEEEEEPEFIPSGLYLRGGVNSWSATTDWEFSKVSETEYKLYNKTLSGVFKIGDATWSNYNFGSNGSNITMDVPYVLTSGSDPANISCGSLSFPCSEIILTIEGDEATLLLVPNTSTKNLTAVYMVGDFNGWNYMDESGKLSLDPSDNLFKGEIGLTAGEDNLSHWMIYQRLALAGAWGLDSDATSSSESGTLIAGQMGHVASTPGMYEVAFDINTGEYTLSALPSQPQKIIINPASAVLVPQLPEKVKVLSLNNSLIHYNDQAKVFNDIAVSMGKDAVWTKHTNLGKTLQYHWDEGDGMTEAGEPGAKMVIRSDAWSHIILQEQTVLPRTDFESFRNSVKLWVDYIRDNCPNPNAVIILPMNWALGQDWSNFSDYNNVLKANYEKVAWELGVVICPVGIAYQSKFDNDGGTKTENEWFLPGDDRHPTLKATYMAALMEYGIIFNEDPTQVSYYPDYKTEEDNVGEMSDQIAAEMRSYASNALNSYNNIVNHHTTTLNLNAAVLDQYGLEMPAETVEWSVSPSTASISNGIFTATSNGEYTVTATSGSLSSSAVISVADALTEVPNIDFITFDEDNLQYSQNFDSMGSDETASIPEGWRADGQLTERTLGSYQTASTTTIKASAGENFGGTAKNGVWNFGDSSDLTDRALGGATTDTSGGAKSINIYAAFKNAGKKAISSLDIEYNIEKYRGGSNSAGFTVQLYTSVDGRNWTKAGSDFNTTFEPDADTAGADVTPMETRHVSGVIDFNLVPGAELYLAWNISATSGTSCMSAPLLSIDDFEISANLKPVPVFDYYIYIEDNSGYEKTALYAWGDKEIWGSWPGQNPIDEVEIDGVTYKVFGHNEATGNYSLIFNNNNNGKQYNDFEIEGGQDYYLKALNDGETIELATSAIEAIETAPEAFIQITTESAYCERARSVALFDISGRVLDKVYGNVISTQNLNPGFYIVVAEIESGNISKKFLKK